MAAVLPVQAQDSSRSQPSPEAAAAEWMIPLHTQPDDVDGAAYGTWAAGPDYKASFDDGFTFYPVLGEDYPRNLPLRWRTEDISAGGVSLIGAMPAASRHAANWRYELRYGTVTEAYDIRTDGVEQTFVLHRDAGGHDVVVTGRIDTELHGQPTSARVQALSFADDAGRPIVRYGEALAFDALGRTIPVTTSFDGERIRLTVDGRWLDNAAFPVTIDPLTSSKLIAVTTAFVNYPNVARDTINDRLMTTYSRASSGSDYDLIGRLLTDDFNNLGLVFMDITANWSTRYASVAYARSADKWIIAFGRENLPGAGVRLYYHDGTSTASMSGNTVFVPRPVGYQDQVPSIGGNATDSAAGRAYLAFRRDQGSGSPNTMHSRIYGVLIDPQNETLGPANNLRTRAVFTTYDAEAPCVTPDNGGLGAWIIGWQEQDHTFGPGDAWDIYIQQVRAFGQIGFETKVGDPGATNRHKLRPQVAGSGGNFLLTYFTRDNVLPFSDLTGDEMFTQRFSWPDSFASPTYRAPRSLVAGPGNGLRTNVTNRAIAFDADTESHWAVGYRTVANDSFVARLGWRGGVVESAVVYADPVDAAGSSGLCYNEDAHEFAIVFGTQQFNRLQGRRFQYQAAANIVFGLSCGPLTIAGDNRGKFDQPFAGSQWYQVTLDGVPNQPAALFLGLNRGSTPIAGCTLLIDPAVGFTHVFTGLTNPLGKLSVPVALPNSILSADVVWQFFQYDGGTGQTLASNGLISQVR